MAVRQKQVKPSSHELTARCAATEAEVHTLRDRIRAVEDERDQARQGLQFLSDALRRRGCCDGHTQPPQ